MQNYMTVKLETINGKPFLRMSHYYKGRMVLEDVARVYDMKGKPYIRRLSERMYLTPDALRGKTEVYDA